MNAKEILFAELVRIHKGWIGDAVDAFQSSEELKTYSKSSSAETLLNLNESQRDAVIVMIDAAVRYSMCTILAAFDGITEMSDHGALHIVDAQGVRIDGNLHYEFMNYLILNKIEPDCD